MKYLPTIDLWTPGIQEALSNGQKRLQVGQRVTAGPAVGRFVGVSDDGSLCIAWWQGSEAKTINRVNELQQALGRRN